MSVRELRDAPLRNPEDVKRAVDDLIRKSNEIVKAVNEIPEGPEGPPGPEGPRGFIGIQGPRGTEGPVGRAGPPGLDGQQGQEGQPGNQGPRGIQGPRGLVGMPGLDGAKGEQGPRGAQGQQGFIGPKGLMGIPGLDGPIGPQGPQGIQGIQGPAGVGTSRGKVTKITAVIANIVEESGSFVLAKSFLLHRIVTSAASRIRLYDSSALRDSDAPRVVGADPVGQSGIIVDLNLDVSMLDYTLSPMTAGANQDPTSNLVYYLIQNKSGAGAAITVDFYITILAA